MQKSSNASLSAIGIVSAAVMATTVSAGITTIDPFTGDYLDGFGQNDQGATQVLDVFGGFGTLSNLSDGGAIKLEFNSTFNGDRVNPRSGPLMVGQLGIGRWDFDAPITEFGGYWENNSGVDDATVFFYDENLMLIDSFVANVPTSGGQWQWNGWASDTPIARIEVFGNGILNGFIWYDDMRITTVPTQGTLALLGVCGLGALRRRRQAV